jgi:hypothetical protein
VSAVCKTCGGTGQVVCLNSHIITDRTRKERCYICGGTGHSSYQSDPDYVRWQAKARASYPRHPELIERTEP